MLGRKQAVPAAAVDQGSNDGETNQPNDDGNHHDDPSANLTFAGCTIHSHLNIANLEWNLFWLCKGYKTTILEHILTLKKANK